MDQTAPVLWASYIAALWTWLPLAAAWKLARRPPPRAMVLPAIAFTAVAGAWELVVPRSANIRIDLLVVVPALAIVNGVTGVLLALHVLRLAAQRQVAIASSLAAAYCLGVAGWVAVASVQSQRQGEEQWETYKAGTRFIFEAAFRDDATQRRFFGELQGDADGWAGYYRAKGAETFPRRIVINTEGRYWTFGESEWMQNGMRRTGGGSQRFVGEPGRRQMYTAAIDLRRDASGRVLLERTLSGRANIFEFVREPAPRFPQPASPLDEVKFVGVFAGVDPERDFVAQVWIWRSGERQWGKYLWQGFSPGKGPQDVVAQRDAEITCEDAECSRFVVRYESTSAAMARVSPDTLELLGHATRGRKLLLTRGEIVPGFVYDLAPLRTAEQNRYWLRAVAAQGVSWDVPSREELDRPREPR